MDPENEMHLQGAPISDGIAIGVPYFLSCGDENIPEFPISLKEVDQEISRYRSALFSSREDLLRLQNRLANEGSSDAIKIIDTHIQMLDDPLMTTHIEDKIREMQHNTESVFLSAIQEYEEKFSQTSDTFFKQRLMDVNDLSKRILRHLRSHHKNVCLADIPPNAVIFAKELAPSDTATVQASRVSAFVTQVGGGNSHAALIAKAKGIPFVASIDLQKLQIADYKCVIVDGETGKVIINPSHGTLKKYKEIKAHVKAKNRLLEKMACLSAETIDGYPIKILANIGSLSDLDSLATQGAMGIGLVRSEYLFLEKREFISLEEGQYETYVELIKRAGKMPVVIRVFDLGGDKLFEEYQEKEPNPVLGCRGIRFLLKRIDIFRTQLRAILRASRYGDVRVLLPLISDIYELKEARRLIQEVKDELQSQRYVVKDIPVGCMIELPSAALIADVLAEESEFLSVGTNDLVQYTLGVDRNNAAMSDFYLPNHLSVIRMIKMITIETQRLSKSLTICGEIASNPFFVPLLLGLGVKEFSCAPRYIPGIKKMVRNCSLVSCFELAQRVLRMRSSLEISNILIEEFEKLRDY